MVKDQKTATELAAMIGSRLAVPVARVGIHNLYGTDWKASVLGLPLHDEDTLKEIVSELRLLYELKP